MLGKICIVRTYSAGVFLGLVAERDGKEVLLKNARRIWYWDGAATLSQLATEGTSKPKGCKFPAPVDEVLLTEAIEFIPATEAAIASIAAVPEWKQ
jgi:hypothetical protein